MKSDIIGRKIVSVVLATGMLLLSGPPLWATQPVPNPTPGGQPASTVSALDPSDSGDAENESIDEPDDPDSPLSPAVDLTPESDFQQKIKFRAGAQRFADHVKRRKVADHPAFLSVCAEPQTAETITQPFSQNMMGHFHIEDYVIARKPLG